MNQKGIWATGAISFAFLGFILLISPITEICGKEASPSQLFNVVGSGATCTNKEIPIDLFLSSAQLAVGGPFVASVICLVLAFLYGPKRDWKKSSDSQD